MKKKQIINWIIFFVLNYLCFIGLQKMEMVISIKYSGVCQGNYGIFFDIFDPSKDTIFWWVVWNLSLHAMSAFIQAGVVTLTILIMRVFDRSETIMKFILWDMGNSKTGKLNMQSFPWIVVLYLFASPEIFRNITILLFC